MDIDKSIKSKVPGIAARTLRKDSKSKEKFCLENSVVAHSTGLESLCYIFK